MHRQSVRCVNGSVNVQIFPFSGNKKNNAFVSKLCWTDALSQATLYSQPPLLILQNVNACTQPEAPSHSWLWNIHKKLHKTLPTLGREPAIYCLVQGGTKISAWVDRVSQNTIKGSSDWSAVYFSCKLQPWNTNKKMLLEGNTWVQNVSYMSLARWDAYQTLFSLRFATRIRLWWNFTTWYSTVNIELLHRGEAVLRNTWRRHRLF